MADGGRGGANGGAKGRGDAFWRELERDYYALLGLRRDAQSDEIRSRFLALSREFHPDRQRRSRDAALVAAANSQYALLDRAYKVLSDPVTRRVYDVYGEKVRRENGSSCGY